jgi:autotransporter adhesin
MDISYTGGAYVDENGALYNSGATEATASLTLTNDLGNTHGIVVTTDQTTISGGTTSSSLTLNDNGATFSDASTGKPVQVHGVADGTSDFDAVNLRQLGGAIASVTAIANIPQIEPNKKFSLGLGFGNYDGYNGFALGAKYRINDNLILQTSAAKSGSQRHTIGAGLSYSW